MQIVIDIPKEIVEWVNKYYDYIKIFNDKKTGIIIDAVKNGTPLPKGHGRLIDADELYDGFIDGTEGYDCQTWNRIEIGDIIEDAPTIIEADKEQEQICNPPEQNVIATVAEWKNKMLKDFMGRVE